MYYFNIKVDFTTLKDFTLRQRKQNLGSYQLPCQIFTPPQKLLLSSSNTQSWEPREMHAFF